MTNFDNLNTEWVLHIAKRLQMLGKTIPEELQRRADKLRLNIRLFPLDDFGTYRYGNDRETTDGNSN